MWKTLKNPKIWLPSILAAIYAQVQCSYLLTPDHLSVVFRRVAGEEEKLVERGSRKMEMEK